MITYWIPELSDHPGLYANQCDSTDSDNGNQHPTTMDESMARRFATEQECRAWCEANPSPVFVPRETRVRRGDGVSDNPEVMVDRLSRNLLRDKEQLAACEALLRRFIASGQMVECMLRGAAQFADADKYAAMIEQAKKQLEAME